MTVQPIESFDSSSVEGSTTRKQKYTYDFESSDSSTEKKLDEINEEEIKKTVILPVHVEHAEHSSENPEKTILIEPALESSTVQSSSEKPAPVTEDLSDDTPMPTENYFKAVKISSPRAELNVMDTTTPNPIQTASESTIYSTTAPIKIDHEDARLRSEQISSSSQKPMYAVTENILEQDTSSPLNNGGNVDQSPFLPESENGESFLSILHHEDAIQNETTDEVKAKKIDIEEEHNDAALLENENENSNLISGPLTHLEHVESSDEKTEIPSDSTEVYHTQESRSHNHEKNRVPDVTSESNEKSTESSETLIIDHLNHIEEPTKTLPVTSDVEESTEQLIESTEEASTEQNEKKLLPVEVKVSTEAVSSTSPSSTTSEKSTETEEEQSTETDLVKDTTVEAKNLNKTDIQAEVEETTVEEHIVSTDHVSESTSEQVSTSSEHVEKVSSTEESLPSSTEISSESSSTTTTTASPLVNSISNQSSEFSEDSSNSIKYLSVEELKVIPLSTTSTTTTTSPIESPEDSSTETETSTENSEESTESTTGHFLSNTTFRLIPSESIETSLNESANAMINNSEDHLEMTTTEKIEKLMQTTEEINQKEDVDEIDDIEHSMEKANFAYTLCTAGQFECKNGSSIKTGGKCISLSERCDSIKHCSDWSDEADCEGCLNHFQCKDGSCLARSKVCDKIVHCTDGSDERPDMCNDWKCEFDEIACSENGPCLPAILQCDGIQHCANQADETNCPDNCKSNEFYCSEQRRCIPETWLCDGDVDCSGKNIFFVNSIDFGH